MRHNKSTRVRVLTNATIVLMGFALFLTTPPAAHAQSTIYAMTQGGSLGTLNLSNGTFTPMSSPGFEPAGLTGLGGNLFIAAYPTTTLYEVNLTNGNIVTIGNGSVDYYDFGATTQGLYAIGTDQNLYAVNAATGASTLIGPTGLAGGGFQSMSSGGSTLYTAVPDSQGQNELLYSVNTTTGAATEVGNTGIAADVSSMGFAFGQLYAADASGNFYTVNTSSGAATLIGNSGQDLWGLGLPPMTYSVIHNFTGGLDGANPWAGLTPDSSGNFYGITQGGGGHGSCDFYGQSGCGAVFKLNHKNGNYTFQPLYGFGGGSDGEFPVRAVTIGPNGSLYAATAGGGEASGNCSFESESSGCGTVVNITPNPTFPKTPLTPWKERILYSFAAQPDGEVAVTTLLFDHAGNMYGTTNGGGTNDAGTVFELSPSGGGNYTEKILYNFAGGNDGMHPLDGLITDSAGNFYGTTASGGSTTSCSGNGCGTVFELSPNGSGWTEKILYAFQGASDGYYPNSGVVMDTVGNLYGNTWQGGSGGGGGTVWELSPNGSNWTLTTIYTVPSTNGNAVGRLVRDSNGNLYEAMQSGGGFNSGQLFELSPSGSNWNYLDLYDFTDGTDAGLPLGSMVFDSSGNMYGTAWGGGSNPCGGGYGCGAIWELKP